jgi:hypothetical protein
LVKFLFTSYNLFPPPEGRGFFCKHSLHFLSTSALSYI